MAKELLSKYKIEKKHRVIGAFALVYWLLSFWWERFAFYEGAAEARPVTHIVIKLLTLITIYLLALFFTNAVQGFKARGAAVVYYRDRLLVCMRRLPVYHWRSAQYP